MNIYLFLIDKSSLGGIERVAINLCETLNKSSSVKATIVDIESLRGVYHSTKSETYLCRQFVKSLNSEDIVISMYDRLTIKLSFFKKVYSRSFRLIASQHADFYANRFHTRFLRRITYRYVDSVTALTEFDASLYRKWHTNVVHIPNPILFYPEFVPTYEERQNVVVAAGRLNKIKRFNDFISLASLMRNINLLSFSIYGDGEERVKLSNFAKKVGVEPTSILMGATDDLESKLLSSKFLVVTSERESFSMVILEAMACGCIPISYDCPTGPRELIRDGENGFLVPVGDIASIQKVIKTMLADESNSQNISENARQMALNYRSNIIRSKWKALLDEL